MFTYNESGYLNIFQYNDAWPSSVGQLAAQKNTEGAGRFRRGS